jgi:hypothetical protein
MFVKNSVMCLAAVVVAGKLGQRDSERRRLVVFHFQGADALQGRPPSVTTRKRSSAARKVSSAFLHNVTIYCLFSKPRSCIHS